jgi:uncharacterized tellurite resistance protein B-like protein
MVEGPRNQDVGKLKTALLEAIQEFFETRIERPLSAPTGPPVEGRVAMAALLLQVARADWNATAQEREAVVRGVERVLGVNREEARRVVDIAEHDWCEARFPELVTLVNQHSTAGHRKELLAWLWQVAYADAEIQVHEEYLVRKIAGLLGLGTADLIEAKLNAREAIGPPREGS